MAEKKALSKLEMAKYGLMCRLDDLRMSVFPKGEQMLTCSECPIHYERKCPNSTEDVLENAIEVLKDYEHLLQIAKRMHTWIFLHTADEFKVYDELGLTDEDNEMLGSIGGPIEINEARKEE